ncbi:glycosyltransferase [Lutimaribacter sp. EGI FJ00015]|uniref:Glycosyltransferase n=1 Tax=Lutimaribacter degradans TaxID=2945989 RepID=A0ACC5ZZZ5_9RHOB|nr:glycosyltransferase [Lutimaribacter sp. EGI FJ00013]MCM2563948.1 glycosyltransferase [Lutimaribacter sp. EGI FJ00013]MCO0615213.1 glycosyltransferase [Lutimaribacter sp. EGI FJ00015]MCO0637806.1 glycosyltransferase [Lutimaribacter sp. EGI FJ00014]
MKLSIVIPVWNDPEGLGRLLTQVAELGLFSEVIVVDDASDDPLGPETVPESRALTDSVIWLRSSEQRGAGHARNIGLDRVTGSHVIFFDSDDLFSDEFSAIITSCETEAEAFDFLIFRHDDTRILEEGGRGSFPTEEARWKALSVDDEPARLTTREAANLCQISAYPWNKIYRTDFLRDNAIRCTEIPVHNDLELHWSSFIVARNIWATTQIGAVHQWHPSGTRLTNRRGDERLAVFQAFENTLSRITSEPDLERLTFLHPFFDFNFRLISWIKENMDDVYLDVLLRKSKDYALSAIDKRLMTLIAYRDPALARKINRILFEGTLP